MARRKRNFSVLSLSFIDTMSCGLGAVVLLFMIINHATEVRAIETNRDAAENLSQIESEVLEKRRAVQQLAASLEQTRQQIEATRARAQQLQESLESDDDNDQRARESRDRIAALKEELQSIQTRVARLREQSNQGDATRRYIGEGDRQYLTGLKIGGRHILILVDTSASMLDNTIVNIVRRRNMDASARRSAPKWRRTVATVDWITTQVPADSRFQIYAFNTKARAVLDGTDGQWLATDSGSRLTAAVRALGKVIPAGGTSLQQAFAAAARLSPRPDNIYLITDGLPTQGVKTRSGTVSGAQRLSYYREALDALPGNVPVNVILRPMEGDPLAASAFWQLAQVSGGSFLAPAEDWP